MQGQSATYHPFGEAYRYCKFIDKANVSYIWIVKNKSNQYTHVHKNPFLQTFIWAVWLRPDRGIAPANELARAPGARAGHRFVRARSARSPEESLFSIPSKGIKLAREDSCIVQRIPLSCFLKRLSLCLRESRHLLSGRDTARPRRLPEKGGKES